MGSNQSVMTREKQKEQQMKSASMDQIIRTLSGHSLPFFISHKTPQVYMPKTAAKCASLGSRQAHIECSNCSKVYIGDDRKVRSQVKFHYKHAHPNDSYDRIEPRKVVSTRNPGHTLTKRAELERVHRTELETQIYRTK